MARKNITDLIEQISRLEERIGALENLIQNHLIHSINKLDTRIWALLVTMLIALLGIWLRR